MSSSGGVTLGSSSSAPITTKTKRFKVKHPKRKLFRSSDPLLSVLMWGVNHTVSELQHVAVPVMLMPEDFRAFAKIKVDNQNFNKENLPSHFKVKEYCPLVFRNLRERFGIPDESYLKSMTKAPVPMQAAGRSGAKFYLSHDKLYVIKTLLSEEVEQMHSLLKHYHPFIVERHGKTLLPQYLGMYRLTVDNAEQYMVVMRNVLSSHLRVHKKYDLKGSKVDREASAKEREKSDPTFKDNDFVADNIKIHIGQEAKDTLMATLQADVDFLAKLHIMDYSLLLGIHHRDHEEPEEDEERGAESGEPAEDDYDSAGSAGNNLSPGGATLTPPDSPNPATSGLPSSTELEPEIDIYGISSTSSAPRREIYFMALVDVLTHYGVKKQAAKVAKTVKYGASVDGISTVDPEQYAARFIDFVAKAIE